MTRVANLLELQIPGIDRLNWDVQLHDLAPNWSRDDIYRRQSEANLTLFGLGPCSRRDAVLGRPRDCFGYDVLTHLNFCRGRLCAVHQYFHSVSDLGTQEYYSALDHIRRRLMLTLGVPALQTRPHPPAQISFRWGLNDLHVELRSSNGAGRDLSLAVNNPAVCSWCLYWQ